MDNTAGAARDRRVTPALLDFQVVDCFVTHAVLRLEIRRIYPAPLQAKCEVFQMNASINRSRMRYGHQAISLFNYATSRCSFESIVTKTTNKVDQQFNPVFLSRLRAETLHSPYSFNECPISSPQIRPACVRLKIKEG